MYPEKEKEEKKFEYRPKLDEEEYAITLVSLFYFIQTPKENFTNWVYSHVKAIGSERGWSEENIQVATRLIVRYWFLKGEALWRRVLERKKGRRKTNEIIKRHFGEQSYDKVLDWVKKFSVYIARISRVSKDALLLELQEVKKELGIE